VLPVPVVLLASALSPMAVLALPMVWVESVLSPTAVLKAPWVLLMRASAPLHGLSTINHELSWPFLCISRLALAFQAQLIND
jgi:hypothetical protein